MRLWEIDALALPSDPAASAHDVAEQLRVALGSMAIWFPRVDVSVGAYGALTIAVDVRADYQGVALTILEAVAAPLAVLTGSRVRAARRSVAVVR